MSHLQLVVPGPVRPAERLTEAVRLRVAPSERDRLIEQARRAGYTNLSEYLRDLARAARSAP